MFTELEILLTSLLQMLPLEVFAFVASFVEEVLAPIPSPTVMILTGSAASVQMYPVYGLIILAIIAALGKTLGAILVYTIANKGEDIVLTKYSRFFPITHEEIENFGTKLSGGVRDYVVLTLLRAFPFMPSVVISVGSGILKINMRLFVISTFIGTIVRDSIYLYFGYVGTGILGEIISKSSSLETTIEFLVIAFVIILLGYLYFRAYSQTSDTRR